MPRSELFYQPSLPVPAWVFGEAGVECAHRMYAQAAW
jgi:hypothetical protein